MGNSYERRDRDENRERCGAVSHSLQVDGRVERNAGSRCGVAEAGGGRNEDLTTMWKERTEKKEEDINRKRRRRRKMEM